MNRDVYGPMMILWIPYRWSGRQVILLQAIYCIGTSTSRTNCHKYAINMLSATVKVMDIGDKCRERPTSSITRHHRTRGRTWLARFTLFTLMKPRLSRWSPPASQMQNALTCSVSQKGRGLSRCCRIAIKFCMVVVSQRKRVSYQPLNPV